MLQFGYNTGVINAPEANIENFMKDVYKSRYGEDIQDDAVKVLYSVAVSIFAIGGMLGGFCGGMIANRFGRKGGLLLNNLLGIVGAVLMGCTKLFQLYEFLFLGRFIIGVNCGLNTSLVPMYISEIAPLNLRGGLGTVNQLAVTVGLLLSQVLGIEQILGTDEGWPMLLGLAVCPPILQLVLLPWCPESPRYLLITKQWEEEARRALRRLRASNQVEEDIEEMRAEERAQQAEATISMLQLICSPTLRSPLIIGVVMQLSQQLSGINAVFYYSTLLFVSSGLTEESAKFATIGIGAIMVGMTLVSIPLMDRTGRRTLHLYGLGGMFIFSIFITISFLIKEFFWLRPGDDRLDVVLVSRVSAELCRVLCCGSGLDSMDDHCRTLLPGSTPRCHVHCCAYQLDGQLPCWYWLPNHEECTGQLHVPAIQCVSCHLLDLHI